MDSTALNFNPNAEVDDGSCLPFQGPENANFEETGSWNFERASNLSCMGGIVSTGGIGFMPTKGINYLFLEVGTGYKGGGMPLHSLAYQDNVDFSKSTKLIFDYSFRGTHTDGSVKVEIFFTANGNELIWSKQLFEAKQVKDETILLNGLKDKGRLMIRLDKSTNLTYWTDGSHRFEIDNIRVM